MWIIGFETRIDSSEGRKLRVWVRLGFRLDKTSKTFNRILPAEYASLRHKISRELCCWSWNWRQGTTLHVLVEREGLARMRFSFLGKPFLDARELSEIWQTLVLDAKNISVKHRNNQMGKTRSQNWPYFSRLFEELTQRQRKKTKIWFI